MNQNEFKKILFRVAFCAMACDGHIDDSEIKELHIIDLKTSYFATIDLSNELKQLIDNFNTKGIRIIEELFISLKENKLNPIQELLILEVALRIINADGIHDENEIKFLSILRSKLELHDEMINDRFGKLEILHTSDYANKFLSKNVEKEFMETFKSLKLTNEVLDRVHASL